MVKTVTLFRNWFMNNLFFCLFSVKPCELPDETPNGYYEIIRGEEFVFGTTIKYFCNEGYVHLE